jgi:kynurenine formamidase
MLKIFVVLVAVLIVGSGITPAQAQSWQPPTDAERCPSRWGADDERGAANLMQAEVILRAARLIRSGEVIEMGFPLHFDMPFYGDRIYNQQIKRSRSGLGSNNRTSNEEIVTAELGQIGTQIDGFTHQTIGNSFYNCVQMDEVTSRTEFSRLGIENAGGMFTRGVLLDVAGLRGVEMLGDQYEITAQDLRDTLERQDMMLMSGDAVIINTGFGRLWGVDNSRYYRTQPGLGVEAAEWLAEQDPMIVGSDSCCVEVNPNPVPGLSSPVHQILLVTHGIYLIESLKLDELVDRNIYEFAFAVQPLKLRGATGSAVAPIALR